MACDSDETWLAVTGLEVNQAGSNEFVTVMTTTITVKEHINFKHIR